MLSASYWCIVGTVALLKTVFYVSAIVESRIIIMFTCRLWRVLLPIPLCVFVQFCGHVLPCVILLDGLLVTVT